MTQGLAQVTGLPGNTFEAEFRRIYSDLYPNEQSLRVAIAHYKKSHPYLELARVAADPEPRISLVNWLLRRSDAPEPPRANSSYVFSDIKSILGDESIDLVYLSPAVIPSIPSTKFPEMRVTLEAGTLEENIGKCLCGIEKNGINLGNFASVLWQGGWDFEDALECGLVDYENKKFRVHLQEPTYQRPVLVATGSNKSETMVNQYILFLGQRGIGVLGSSRRPPIPGFSFVGENHRQADGIGYVLDHLSFF